MEEKTDDTREVLTIIRELAKNLRLFQQQAVFCEGLSFSQFSILEIILSSNDAIEMAELHKRLSVEKSTTTRLLEPLIKRSLVQKVQSERDPRAFTVIITDEGKRVHTIFLNCVSLTISTVTESIPPDKKSEVLKGVKMFVSALNNCCDRKGCC